MEDRILFNKLVELEKQMLAVSESRQDKLEDPDEYFDDDAKYEHMAKIYLRNRELHCWVHEISAMLNSHREKIIHAYRNDEIGRVENEKKK